MKIGLVLDDTLDTPDGVQQYVLQVGSWLTEQGHEVHYLVGATERTDIPHIHSLSRNMKVKFNGNRMSMPLPASKRVLRRFLHEQQFDVLHVQVPYSPFMAGRLILAAPKTTAVIGTFHILPYSTLVTLANRALGVLNRRSGKRFDRMLAVSAPAAKFAHQTYGYDAKVVPNPVRLAQFAEATSTDMNLNIIFMGRLVARKGALQLLQAVAYLRDQGLYDGVFKVNIAGKGELRPVLEQFVREHRLQDVVTFLGFVTEEDKANVLAAGDIVAYPSTGGESFGIVLLEGMAAARGVVLAGNNPGYASVMQPYPDQLFDPNDVRVFAERLAWYLSDDHQAARERAAMLQHEYVQHFDVEVVGAELLTTYGQALQSHRQS